MCVFKLCLVFKYSPHSAQLYPSELTCDMFGFNMISHIGGLGLVATFNTPPLATAQTSHHHFVHTCRQSRPSLFTLARQFIDICA